MCVCEGLTAYGKLRKESGFLRLNPELPMAPYVVIKKVTDISQSTYFYLALNRHLGLCQVGRQTLKAVGAG